MEMEWFDGLFYARTAPCMLHAARSVLGLLRPVDPTAVVEVLTSTLTLPPYRDPLVS